MAKNRKMYSLPFGERKLIRWFAIINVAAVIGVLGPAFWIDGSEFVRTYTPNERDQWWMDTVAKFIPALITLVVGTIAGYIAYRQHVVHRDKHRFDLFDRRYRLFKDVEKLRHSALTCSGDFSDEGWQAQRSLNELREIEFFFPPSVFEYYEQIARIALRLGAVRTDSLDPNIDSNIERVNELRDLEAKYIDELLKKFFEIERAMRPYISFRA
ncbi:MAG: hypothetical protein AAGI48_03905 [Verrucomicrobiota bacterium]